MWLKVVNLTGLPITGAVTFLGVAFFLGVVFFLVTGLTVFLTTGFLVVAVAVAFFLWRITRFFLGLEGTGSFLLSSRLVEEETGVATTFVASFLLVETPLGVDRKST